MKRIFKSLFIAFAIFIMFACYDVKASMLCEYSRNESDLYTLMRINSEDNSYVIKTFDSNNKSYDISLKKGKLKEENSSLTSKTVYLSNSAIENLNNSKCPKNAYLLSNGEHCLDDGNNYCKNKNADYLYLKNSKDLKKLINCEYQIKNTDGNICRLKLSIMDNNTVKSSLEQQPNSDVYYFFDIYKDTGFKCDKNLLRWNRDNSFSGAYTTFFEAANQFIQLSQNTTSCPTIHQETYNSNYNKLDKVVGFYFTIDSKNDLPDDNYKPDEDISNNCEVLPKAIENYIRQALKLIRWGGLVLMVVLGTLDFVKASASDDQDAIKKASQNFIKRLIAVIILFLLPILVELILFIAGKIGFNFGECYNVSEF